MKFIIIYSDGPMASTCLGSLIEHYGFINLPFRKFFLAEYIMGLKTLADKDMQYRFLDIINWHNNLQRLGGTSVKDRNRLPLLKRASKPTKNDISNFLSFNPISINSLVSHSFEFASQYITYKEQVINPKGIIIYELRNFNKEIFYSESEYIQKLSKMKDFKCFIMDREFKYWVSSLISQQDSTINIFKNVSTISLEKLYKRWLYNKSIIEISKTYHVSIEALLKPNTYIMNKEISEILSLPEIDKKILSKKVFDLYGSLFKFKKAFNPSDKSFEKSIFIAKIILNKYPKSKYLMRIFLNNLFNILRIFKVIIYK